MCGIIEPRLVKEMKGNERSVCHPPLAPLSRAAARWLSVVTAERPSRKTQHKHPQAASEGSFHRALPAPERANAVKQLAPITGNDVNITPALDGNDYTRAFTIHIVSSAICFNITQ